MLNCHRTDLCFAYSIINTLPEKVRGIVVQGYNNVLSMYGRQSANLYLINHKEAQHQERENNKMLSGDADIIKRTAAIHAYQCKQLINENSDPKVLKRFTVMRSVTPPLLNKNQSNIKGFHNRLIAKTWWVKKLFTLQKRLREQVAINDMKVHKGQGGYISAQALNDYLINQQKSKLFLQNSVIVNKKTGEEIPLESIFNASIAAPENRRIELMIRAGGLEYCADNLGHAAYFITITCPSKYHAINSKTLKPNPNYRNYTPKQASDYLVNNWSRIRAEFDDKKINVYGLRVAEPHHDGCPHWHLLLWGSESDLKKAYAIIKKESLRIDGNEAGAQRRRTELEVIDRTKGSAVGYVAKYIAKNINGNTGENDCGLDLETGKSVIESAVRVRAWSNLWGIRQFQFFGAIPVGLWRELRRLKDVHTVGLIDELSALAENGKKFDYGAIIEKIGGVGARKKDLKIAITKREQEGFDRWGEPKKPKIAGLIVSSDKEVLEQAKQSVKDAVKSLVPEKVTCSINSLIALKEFVTRSDEWEIRTVQNARENAVDFSEHSEPWIHVNNCRNLHESEFYEKPPPARGKVKNDRITI